MTVGLYWTLFITHVIDYALLADVISALHTPPPSEHSDGFMICFTIILTKTLETSRTCVVSLIVLG